MQYESDVLRRLQLIELEILIEIDRVCREHEICYFLDSGSVLGAVRHGGFIPWDDDIDIGMTRENYDRFLQVANEGAFDDCYVVCDPSTDDRLAGMFAKVWRADTKFYTDETIESGISQGIFVDVFPYDVVCGDEAAARKQMRYCRIWQSLSYLYHAKTIVVPHRGIVGSVEKALCRVAHGVISNLFSVEKIRKSFEGHAQAARNEDSNNEYANMSYTMCGSFPKEIILPPSPLVFEGVEFPGPADPIAYLEIMYGKAWVNLPPVEHRRNHAPVDLDFGGLRNVD